jgi:raffinose/stachyose/melibiose transport system substrate-binding protein
VDVSIGNNQIKWAYQEEYSKLIAEWLLGKRSLDDSLKGATAIRTSVTRAK